MNTPKVSRFGPSQTTTVIPEPTRKDTRRSERDAAREKSRKEIKRKLIIAEKSRRANR